MVGGFMSQIWIPYKKPLLIGQGAELKAEAGIEPALEIALYREPKTALKANETSDLLIVDGKALCR